jgi:hypothetical protein
MSATNPAAGYAMFGGWIADDDLHQTVPETADMPLHQDGPKLLQTGRGIIQRTDDRLAFGDLEREHPDASGERMPQAHLEILVVDEGGELTTRAGRGREGRRGTSSP